MMNHIYPEQTKILKINGSTLSDHSAELRLKCKDKEEFLDWLKEHQALSGITFRVQSARGVTKKTVVYKAIYRCQHNTLPSQHNTKKPSKKHTGCESKLTVTIKSSPKDRKLRSKDELRKEFPTCVVISHKHNHAINTAEVVKFKDPREDVKGQFLELFNSYHPPARALDLYKQYLQEEFEDDYFEVAADRSICPDLQWVYRLYYKTFKKEFGDERDDFKKTLQDLEETYTKQGIKAMDVERKPDFGPEEVDDLMVVPDDVSGKPNASVSVPPAITSEAVKAQVEQKIDEISCLLKEQSLANPELFLDALNSFHGKLLNVTKTESSLISALHSFGTQKYLPMKVRKNTTIPVQPTAIARRKAAIKVRRCLQSGRPAMATFTKDGYSRESNLPKKAPHCLQECVD